MKRKKLLLYGLVVSLTFSAISPVYGEGPGKAQEQTAPGEEPQLPEDLSGEDENAAAGEESGSVPQDSQEKEVSEESNSREFQEEARTAAKVPKASPQDAAPPNEEGQMPLRGWVEEEGIWYFYREDGTKATGWMSEGSLRYYLQEDGSLSLGLTRIDHVLYYFDPIKGHLRTDSSSWHIFEGEWYYLQSGVSVTGWKWIGSDWYYFYSDGKMAVGRLELDGTLYFLNKDGSMAVGWYLDTDGSWYYLNASGTAKTGWLQLGNTW